jgi:hypothetical protein
MKKMYVGEEVGNTPMYGTQTLFVVGLQDYVSVISAAEANECDHIFLGANFSFNPEDDQDEFNDWEELIFNLLDSPFGYHVTLDIEIPKYSVFIKDMVKKFPDNFYPLLSVRLPNILEYGPNATIKIDDIGFNKTNPGIWCFPLDDSLKDWGFFNTWDEMINNTV